MNPYLYAPLAWCLWRIIRDMMASRRLHRWPYGEAAPATMPEHELAPLLRAVVREREALDELLARGELEH